MAKLPLDLGKFKKVSSSENTATLIHPHGHSIHISLQALDPSTRKMVDSLPLSKSNHPLKLDEGGSVEAQGSSGASNIPGGSGSPYKDPKKAKEIEDSANESGWQPKKWVDNVKKEFGLNEGGEAKQENPKSEESRKQSAKPKKMADGGDPGAPEDKTYNWDDLKEGVINFAKPVQDWINKGLEANDAPTASQPSNAAETPPASGGLTQYVDQASNASADQSNTMPAEAPSRQIASQEQNQPAEESSPQVGSASAQAASQQPDLMGGYNQSLKGIEQEAAAKGKLGQVQSGILQEAADIKQQQMQDFKTNYDELNQERLSHIEDIKNGHVDPDKYWDNHSKLAAGLGIILAGFNPKGGPNQALGFINDNINRSMQAQAQNLNSQNNLLNANLHQFGNLKDATAMTRVMMNDVMANKLDMEAAKAQDPLAKARALQLKGQLQMQVAPELVQLSMRKMLMKAAQQGNAQGDETGAILPMLRVLNPAAAKEIESRYVPGVGTASIPIPDKAREELQARQSLQEQVHNLRQWAAKHSGELSALSPEDVNYGKALAASVQDKYRSANGQGVFREAEADFVKGIVADDPTAFFNKYRVDPKYRALEDSNLMTLNGLKRSYGLPQSKAQEMPNIKTMGGVQYRKVPGGWQKVQ